MALRGTLTHRKTRRLASALGIDQCRALGILEALWHVTAENQTDGGIGRMSNQDIADEMYYGDSADGLIAALVKSGWLDQVEDTVERGRLFVHDWHEHADDSVNSKLIQWTKCYANGEPARLRKLPKDARERVAARYIERYGPVIGEKLRSLRKNDDLAHIQSPESRVQSQSPEVLKAEERKPAAPSSPPQKPTEIPKRRGTRFPGGPIPVEWVFYANKKYNWGDSRIAEVYECFSDWWAQKSGQDATKMDWFAAWRTWCRRESDRAGPAAKQTQFEDKNQVRRDQVSLGLKWLGGISGASTERV